MDIRTLQRAIVDGLEDVKGQDIQVFDTEHLSALFERVVVASGTSNRQTKALAASVRDAVRQQGGRVFSVEGEDNGEWIIVDCGAAVVHIMQPAIRTYYHLEEIWGDKPVKLKAAAKRGGLVKASEPAAEAEPKPKRAPRKTAAAPSLAQTVAAKQAAAKKGTRAAPAKAPARKRTALSTAASTAASATDAPPARKAPARKAAAPVVATKRAAPRKSAATKTPATKAAAKTVARKAPAAKKTAPRKAAARKA